MAAHHHHHMSCGCLRRVHLRQGLHHTSPGTKLHTCTHTHTNTHSHHTHSPRLAMDVLTEPPSTPSCTGERLKRKASPVIRLPPPREEEGGGWPPEAIQGHSCTDPKGNHKRFVLGKDSRSVPPVGRTHAPTLSPERSLRVQSVKVRSSECNMEGKPSCRAR